MSPRIAVSMVVLLGGCSRVLGDLQPDNEWPAILEEYADYQGTGGGQVGDQISAFALPDQSGTTTDFRQFLGFVTVIDVGALWCIPCQETASTQQAFLEQLQADPVWIVSVIAQDNSGGPPDPDDSAMWAQQFGLKLPVLADLFQEQHQDWEVVNWPTTLVVAPDGTVLTRHDGVVSEEDVAADVADALESYADQLRTP